ncbi:MAG: hypothetical protein OXE52_18570 [Chloroflexi bacterium]|nr:hypothetical protein [Chloroflexota bacterium]
MSYGRSKSDLNIKADQIALLAELFDVDMASEDLEGLAAALSNQLPSIAVLEAFDLEDFPPILRMDAGWND